MITRIHLIIQAKNLTASQFADEIGVQRSSISHILSGRNNPSLDFILKILMRYPEIHSDWLLFGKGSMYLSENKPHIPQEIDLFSNNHLLDSPVKKEPELFDLKADKNDLFLEKEEKKEIKEEKILPIQVIENSIKAEEEINDKILVEKKIKKIIILNNDNTFEEYFRQ